MGPITASAEDAPAAETDLFEGGHFYTAPFALAVTDDFDVDNAIYGGGIKLGYDFTRTAALEGYAAALGEDMNDLFDHGRAIDQAGGDFKLRQPFLKHLAITESAGADYNFNERDLFVHARAGLELKLTQTFGGFADIGLESDFDRVRFPVRGGLSLTF